VIAFHQHWYHATTAASYTPNRMTPGMSSISFEQPDTTVWRFVGDVSEDGMRALTLREKQLIEGVPYLLKLVDMSQAGNISAEARKAGAEKIHDVPVMAVAIFGANFTIRVLANLVIRAGCIMRKIDTVPTRFFETEAEGRVWLLSKRTELQAIEAAPVGAR
jgi:hypothetical protein